MSTNRFSRILLRGGTKQELKTINPMLKEREPIVEYDTGRMKIGDGINRYNSLKYVGGGSSGDDTPIITSFKIDGCVDKNKNVYDSVVPKGATITDVTLSYIISSIPDEIVISDSNTIYYSQSNPEILTNTFKIENKNITSNTTYSLTLKHDGKSNAETANLYFSPYIYYMVSELDTQQYLDSSIDYNSLSDSVNKKLITGRSNVLENIDSGDNKYIYIFIPSSIYKEPPTFKVGDFGGGFKQLSKDNLDSFDSTKITKISNEFYTYEDYYVYRSTYPGLGIKTINIS